MMNVSPLAISTTGRASTGVGLTAAVVQDKQSGTRTLQAGAMVLADRGIVCVDEFDKMNDIDRVAMHEVMEQQTVTIAKAGVQTTLNARCSVIAAANPIYGQYNREITIQKNIGLPDSLLSRFDLVFIVLDKSDSALDREIADHVLSIHRNKNTNVNENVKSLVSQELHDTEETDKKQEDIFNVFKNEKYYSTDFLKKYIYYMKYRIKPELTNEASTLITQKYCELRKSNSQKTLPVTPRTLESIIRLATAHAKCRMGDEVTVKDVEEVCKILEYALYFTDDSTNQKKEPLKVTNKKRKREEETIEEDTPIEKKPLKDDNEEKKEIVRKELIRLVRESRNDALEVSILLNHLNKIQKISKEELLNILTEIANEEDAKIMVDDETIFVL
jgi:DNA replication licensing factor MCM3